MPPSARSRTRRRPRCWTSPGGAVETTTFDGLVAAGEASADDIGLVWVDVEGTEASVFEGAQTLLVRGVPLVVEPLFDSEGAERAAAAERLLQETYTHFLDLWARDFKEMPFRPLGALGDLAAAQRKKGLLFVRLPDQS